MADKRKSNQIELPDYFIHNGVTFEPGVHIVEDEAVAKDLLEAKARYLKNQERKQAEEDARLQAINVTGKVELATEGGVSMDQIQAVVKQAVEAETANLRTVIEQQEAQIRDLQNALEEEEEEEEKIPSNAEEESS